MKSVFNKIFLITALILLFGQGANQVFCGDIDCLEEDASGHCSTLLCSIFSGESSDSGNGTHSNPAGQDSDGDCPCVCHIQFNSTDAASLKFELTIIGQITVDSTEYSKIFIYPIYHPPTV
ncbi:MAG: hypothetical protein DWQ05_22500 [Calditrichaeota bacterium]|nr:MAG: hypothetical protein DWQ05_22500 [Calditrichota bacterium]